jgi:excisionase family DNA binding protein
MPPENDSQPPERLYSLEEVARHLKVSVRTIKRFVAARKLAVVRFGRVARVSEAEFARFVREGTQPSPVSQPSQPLSVRVTRSAELDRRVVFEMARSLSTPKPHSKKSKGDPK